jgi:hypothetical protein
MSYRLAELGANGQQNECMHPRQHGETVYQPAGESVKPEPPEQVKVRNSLG